MDAEDASTAMCVMMVRDLDLNLSLLTLEMRPSKMPPGRRRGGSGGDSPQGTRPRVGGGQAANSLEGSCKEKDTTWIDVQGRGPVLRKGSKNSYFTHLLTYVQKPRTLHDSKV